MLINDKNSNIRKYFSGELTSKYYGTIRVSESLVSWLNIVVELAYNVHVCRVCSHFVEDVIIRRRLHYMFFVNVTIFLLKDWSTMGDIFWSPGSLLRCLLGLCRRLRLLPECSCGWGSIMEIYFRLWGWHNIPLILVAVPGFSGVKPYQVINHTGSFTI